MTIAVTGASGFVGGHVLRALARLTDAPIIALSRRKPAALPEGVRWLALDIESAGLQDYARIGAPATLVHLAWGGLPNYRSRHHFEAELPRHYRFLKAMVEAGLPTLLVAGTCYEYGMADGELSEHQAPAPDNAYAFAKATLLRQLTFLQCDYPLSLTWARLFYMWGEGQAPNSIYPLLQAAAARGDATFPMSGGEQLRDYLPIEQVSALLAKLALQGKNHGVVNVCSGEPVSVRALVERWIRDEGLAIVPDLGAFPYPTHEPRAFWGSNRKLLGALAGADEENGDR